ncbi:MAG: hypothetical protein H7X71_07975 [Chitinophagales bacterium]|nr:hypothetical protein [Chitinophagales bacterium]
MRNFSAIIFLLNTLCLSQSSFAQAGESGFDPTIKMKGLIHSRLEVSLTDSVDVQNKFSAEPISSNFRIRRLELRSDIKLTNKFSGVIRIQLPALKTTSTNTGNVIELGYLEYKVRNEFQIRFGQFKIPYELDELTSHEDLRMVDRGTTSVLMVNNFQASYQPGLMLFGNLLKDKTPLNYYLAVVNGGNRALAYDDNAQKNLIGRLEFFPVKGFRIGAGGQIVALTDATGNSYGVDLQVIQNVSTKTKLIVEGEYIQAINLADYAADTTALKDIADFNLSGYFGQVLFKIDIDKSWCKTFEAGGKYENTDPRTAVDANSFSTITGNIGFTFLPDNTARLQFNIVHTSWDTPISGTIDAGNMFVTQFQLKI